MEELDKYLNNFYLEWGDEYIFAYQFTKVDGRYGVICYEAQLRPDNVWIYNDFPEDQEHSIDFLKSFIPELDKTCLAKQISEGHYTEIRNRLSKLKVEYDAFHTKITKFIKYGLGQEV